MGMFIQEWPKVGKAISPTKTLVNIGYHEGGSVELENGIEKWEW